MNTNSRILKMRSRRSWIIGGLLLAAIVIAFASRSAFDAQAQADETNIFLPLVSKEEPIAIRIGYGVTSAADGSSPADIEAYDVAPSLEAGWYLDWGTRPEPKRPNGIEYAQMIRVHQTKSCGERYRDYDNRADCPLLNTYSAISSERLAQIAENNPGALYLIGNEVERVDWGNNSGQDEITPEVYAVAYHDLYTEIKALDPTAKVAIGGVIQATELRLQWLQRAWDEYKRVYGEPMPVEVWNVHFFAIREVSDSWGADIPAGLIDPTRRTGPDETRQSGAFTTEVDRARHGDIEELRRQTYRFREFMKNLEPSQQDKPLIVTEYGLLYPNSLICDGFKRELDLKGRANCSNVESNTRPGLPELEWHENDDDAPIAYMLDSFDFFLNEKNCDLGYTADDCRLVQKWNWYSLDDKRNFNEYTKLIDPQTGEITNTGRAFRDWVNENFDELTSIGGW